MANTPIANRKRTVVLHEHEAAALASFIKYAGEMSDVLKELYPILMNFNPPLAARSWTLASEANLAIGCSLDRLYRAATEARTSFDRREVTEVENAR